eukprot:317272-Pleurochrysis_carterae.AAC.1
MVDAQMYRNKWWMHRCTGTSGGCTDVQKQMVAAQMYRNKNGGCTDVQKQVMDAQMYRNKNDGCTDVQKQVVD